MLSRIVDFSIHHRAFVLIAAVMLVIAGVYSAITLPIDAVPDISQNQVVVNTLAPSLAPEEIERQVTQPIEVELSGLPGAIEMRSVSQFGLSQIAVMFRDDTDIHRARAMVHERLSEVAGELPTGVEPPRMAPIATGLGEIYYVFVEGEGRSLMERRSILDWQVKPRLRTVPGVIEVNSYGGHVKQYQVLGDPDRMRAHGVTIQELLEAVENNNRNAGGAWIPKENEQQIVQGIGVVKSLDDIRSIVLKSERGSPVLVGDVARVEFGPEIRHGTITKDGKGEAVAAIAVMLMGENSRTVTQAVKQRVAEIQKQMPQGIELVGFLDRTTLVDETLHTAADNLLHGGLLVILILFLFLLQFRAGLIVSSAIPLAMLFAIIGMKFFGVSANLMSLGAVDFGLIVDGAVIIVENCVRRLADRKHALGRDLTEEERLETIRGGTVEVRQASQFGEMIIIAAYLPILSLVGIEGKMFRPMGMTVVLALIGGLLLSMTLIPALCATFLRVRDERENPVIAYLQTRYLPVVRWAIAHRKAVVGGAFLFFGATLLLFPRLGSEFIPKLDEGALTINPGYLPGISVETAIERATLIEKMLLAEFPDEIKTVATRIGRPDIATDPMLLSQHDVFIPLEPRSKWTKAKTKNELIEQIQLKLEDIPGMKLSFSQPIEMRMNEMSEGVGIRADLGVKVMGPDMAVLQEKATEIAGVLRQIPGGADVMVEATAGLPVLQIRLRRADIARHGLSVDSVQRVIETAVGGSKAGQVAEDFERYDIFVRYDSPYRDSPEAIGSILVEGPAGQRIPLAVLAEIESIEGPVQYSHENGERRIVVQANVRGRDLGSYVEEAKERLGRTIGMPSGYHLEYGGQYEHLQSGRARLAMVVPVTFGIIFFLLYTTYRRVFDAARVFTGIPFAISGGILALYLRGMPFSMSAGIGFIALSGIAVLDDMVMVQTIRNNLDKGLRLRRAVESAVIERLRPVLMTATVAAIGFLPMALSTGTGAEVQKPLATVVIGGLITSTLLTLLVLPALYTLVGHKHADALDDERSSPLSNEPKGSLESTYRYES